MPEPSIKVNSSSDDELRPVHEIIRKRRDSETHHGALMKRKHKSSSGVDRRDESPPKKVKHEEAEEHAGSPIENYDEAPRTSNSRTAVKADTAESSLFLLRRSSLYVPLSPVCNEQPLDGICAEHLSPLILTYYPPFKGVVLAYEGATLSNQPDEASIHSNEPVLARALDEYAASYVWVTATFLLFCPKRGQEIEGWVTLQNESHLGLVCWNYFTASISRDRLPSNWTWVSHSNRKKRKSKRSHDDTNGETSKNQWEAAAEDTGYFRDENGQQIEGALAFRVAEVDLTSDLYREKSALSLRGTLLSAEDEANLQLRRASRFRRSN